MALDYIGKYGVATAIGHAPIIGLINPAKGSVNAIAESLTNIVWASCRTELSQLVYPPIGCGV